MTFKRPLWPTRDERLAAREENYNRVLRERLEYVATNPTVRGTMGGTTTGPRPKEAVLESAAYENAVRDLGYCVRCGWRGRPQFCHRDQGKGTGIKTDVREGWAGCERCHALLGGHAGGTRMEKEDRRAEELHLAKLTRRALRARRTWPKSVPDWPE